MQTFLTSDYHYETACCLDNKRLNKQIIECYQIIRIIMRKIGILDDGKKGWLNHPVLKFWQAENGKWCIFQLEQYIRTMIRRYEEIFKKQHSISSKLDEMMEYIKENPNENILECWANIKWSSKVYDTMASNLIRKNENHYKKFFPNHKPIEGYVWEKPYLIMYK